MYLSLVESAGRWALLKSSKLGYSHFAFTGYSGVSSQKTWYELWLKTCEEMMLVGWLVGWRNGRIRLNSHYGSSLRPEALTSPFTHSKRKERESEFPSVRSHPIPAHSMEVQVEVESESESGVKLLN